MKDPRPPLAPGELRLRLMDGLVRMPPMFSVGPASLTDSYNCRDRTNIAVLGHALGASPAIYRGTLVWIYATTCAFCAATGF